RRDAGRASGGPKGGGRIGGGGMMHRRILGLLVIVAVTPAIGGEGRAPEGGRTLTGCSGKGLEEYGIARQVFGTWMARSSWDDLAEGNWLMAEESEVPRWRRDHFDRALDVGVPLIPTESGRDFNELLAEAAGGARDATYRSLGKSLARHGT